MVFWSKLKLLHSDIYMLRHACPLSIHVSDREFQNFLQSSDAFVTTIDHNECLCRSLSAGLRTKYCRTLHCFAVIKIEYSDEGSSMDSKVSLQGMMSQVHSVCWFLNFMTQSAQRWWKSQINMIECGLVLDTGATISHSWLRKRPAVDWRKCIITAISFHKGWWAWLYSTWVKLS